MIVTKTTVKTACMCNGCRKVSKFVIGDKDVAVAHVKKFGWIEHWVPVFSKNGRRLRNQWSIHQYCPKCAKKLPSAMRE